MQMKPVKHSWSAFLLHSRVWRMNEEIHSSSWVWRMIHSPSRVWRMNEDLECLTGFSCSMYTYRVYRNSWSLESRAITRKQREMSSWFNCWWIRHTSPHMPSLTPASHTSRYPASLTRSSNRPTGSFRWGWLSMSPGSSCRPCPGWSPRGFQWLTGLDCCPIIWPSPKSLASAWKTSCPRSCHARDSVILVTPSHAHVSPGLVVVDHRVCDGRRTITRQWWSRPDWRATTSAWHWGWNLLQPGALKTPKTKLR